MPGMLSIKGYGAILASAIVAFAVLRLLMRGRFIKGVIDHPNGRSLHSVPTPRIGGLALVPGLMVGWAFLFQPWMLPLFICVVALAIISFIDDVRSMSITSRFLWHFLSTLFFLSIVLLPAKGWLATAIAIFAMVWIINLYNFMDGSDGLAAGMTIFGFASYALAAYFAGDLVLATISLCISSAAIPFLYFNFNPARIFMGDAGAIPLGFLVGALGMIGWQRADWQLWFPVLVFSPFIVDASVTLVSRLIKGDKFWLAHRSHYYQRLVQMGWGHRKTALAEYALMIATGTSAIWLTKQSFNWQAIGLMMWCCVYLSLAIWVNNRWQSYNHQNQAEAS